MYESQTFDVIMSRLMNNEALKGYDTREGAFVWNVLSPAALELVSAYQQLDRLLMIGFVQTSYGEYLDLRGNEFGVPRKQATKSKGILTVIGDEDATIPKGSIFSTASGIGFVTLEEATIDNSGQTTIPIEAVDAGKKGNVAANRIIAIPVSIAGVNEVTNPNPTFNGTDMESDEDYRQRIFDKVRLPATSGNKYHYMFWAKEISGIKDAKVFPEWNGPGTVKVVLLSDDGRSPSSEKIKEVTEHIEKERPILAGTLTVEGAAERAINISAKLALASGETIEAATQKIRLGLEQYFKSLAFVDPLVRYTRISSIILDIPNIIDFSDLLVNGGIENVELNDDEVPVVGQVDMSEQ